MYKVNNKDTTRMTSGHVLVSLLLDLKNVTYASDVSIFYFEQINASWVSNCPRGN